MDREKVLKGLECCIQSERDCVCPEDCPFADADETDDLCETQVKLAALELLKGEKKMTWGELDKYAEEKLIEGINNIQDWRPADWLMINDIVKVQNNEAYVPFGIRYWLTNGDSIIYVKGAV